MPSRVVWPGFHLPGLWSPELRLEVPLAAGPLLTEVCALLGMLCAGGVTANTGPQEMVVILALLFSTTDEFCGTEKKKVLPDVLDLQEFGV